MMTLKNLKYLTVLVQILGIANAFVPFNESDTSVPYIEFFGDSNCQNPLEAEFFWTPIMRNQSSSTCVQIDPYYSVNASTVMLFTPRPNNKQCVLGIYVDSKCDEAIDLHTDEDPSCVFLPPPAKDRYYSSLFCLI
jgi:hypothetical protein